MKKLAATILGICSMVAYVHAQGTFVIDSSANTGSAGGPLAASGGLVYISPDTQAAHGVLDTSTDISLAMMWGTTAGGVSNHMNLDPTSLNTAAYASSGNWIASQATGGSDVTGYGSGALLDANGISYQPPGEAAGTTIFLVLQGWTGNAANYAAAQADVAAKSGQTSVFSITLAAANAPTLPDVRGMSALTLVVVPEPSILALSGIGAAGLMLIRRRK